jgi:hypothetical protein
MSLLLKLDNVVILTEKQKQQIRSLPGTVYALGLQKYLFLSSDIPQQQIVRQAEVVANNRTEFTL